VPDFRKKADRDRYRSDDWQLKRYDVKRGVFAGAKLNKKASTFSTTMKDVISYSTIYRAYADWKKVQSSMTRPEEFLPVATKLLGSYDQLATTYKDARDIIKAYPKSDGARVLSEMLEIGEHKKALAPGFLPALKKEVAALHKKFGEGITPLQTFTGTALLPNKERITAVKYPEKSLTFSKVEYAAANSYSDIRSRYKGNAKKDGLVYARGFFISKKAVSGSLRIGADGPFKVFVQRKEVGCNPGATNPITAHLMTIPIDWKKGKNEIVIAMQTNSGSAWGFMASAIAK
jgi:hypothetical protein